jgi:membrane protease YdiL (CAAX protease family)
MTTTSKPPNTPSADAPEQRADQLPFAQLGRLGRTSWPRHLAAIGTIILFWIVGGGAAAVLVTSLTTGVSPAVPSVYLALMASFVPMLAGTAVAVRFIHKRPLITLITPFQGIDKRRLLLSFGVYFALATAARLAAGLLHPEQFRLTFQPIQWLALLPVVVILTAIQTTAEELLFRSYALQALGLLTRHTWLLVGTTALLFGALHLANSEVSASPPLMAAFYLATGAFFALITLRDNRLELALGAHAAGNLTVLVVNTETTSLPIRPVWQISEIHPVSNLIAFLVVAATFYTLMVARRHRRTSAAEPATSPLEPGQLR